MTKPRSRSDERGIEGWRFFILNSFVDVHMRTHRGIPASVFVVLWRDSKLMTTKAKNPEYVATTSRTSLASRIGCSESAVTKAVKQLKSAGLVRVIRHGRPGLIAQYQVRYVKPEGG